MRLTVAVGQVPVAQSRDFQLLQLESQEKNGDDEMVVHHLLPWKRSWVELIQSDEELDAQVHHGDASLVGQQVDEQVPPSS